MSVTGDRPLASTQVMRFAIGLTEKVALAASGAFALSPDARQLAFVAVGSDGVLRLWVRSLDLLEARPLFGSESPAFPPFFWSPDSRFIAFDGGRTLKKIAISGGPAETICDVPGLVVGGSWNRDGVIIFGNSVGGLMQVSASGGTAAALTIPDPSRGESYHSMPSFLPDGQHFIYVRRSKAPDGTGVYFGSLNVKPEEQEPKRLLTTNCGAAYLPSVDGGPDRLLFLRGENLMAQPFDSRQLSLVGEAVTVAEGLGGFLDFGFFSVAASGILFYRAGGAPAQLTWFDQRGRRLGGAGEPGALYSMALSPDGMRAAVGRFAPGLYLWLVDFSRGTTTRFTFGSATAGYPVWSPDGSRIVFASSRDGGYDLYEKPASGAREEQLLLKSSEGKYPTSWSRDGRFLLYRAVDPKTRDDLWVLPLEGDRKPFPFLCTEFNERCGHFSPDGRWVAYSSDESGREEIYVRPFQPDSSDASSEVDGKWLISTGGGTEPRWSGDGKMLYYLAPDRKVMAVEITPNSGFGASVPKALFQAPIFSTTSLQWDVTADGKRFLFPATTAQSEQAPFTVVLNWQAALKK